MTFNERNSIMKADYNIFEGAERLKKVQPSPIRAILEKAMKMKAQGLPVVALSAGEPDFNTPTDIKEETAKALLVENQTHYASNRGDPGLRKVLGKYILRETGVEYDPEREILVTGSGAEALNNTIMALVSEGDEVIIPTPAFVSYKTLTEMCSGKFIDMPLKPENDFEIDLDELKSLISDKTKMLIINNPCNPTGAVYGYDTLKELCRLACEHNFIILSDEIYSRMTYDGRKFFSIASFPGMKERSVIVNGFSKAFAMTGWRLGYIAADERIISLALRIHQYSTTCTSTFSQIGAARGMMTVRTDEEVDGMVEAFARRRRLLMECLDKIDKLSYIKPYGAFYMMVNVSKTGLTGQEFARRLLEEKYVATVPAIGLGASCGDYIRISYATSDENIVTAMDRMKEFTASLCE